jgi:hypothetical protein
VPAPFEKINAGHAALIVAAASFCAVASGMTDIQKERADETVATVA